MKRLRIVILPLLLSLSVSRGFTQTADTSADSREHAATAASNVEPATRTLEFKVRDTGSGIPISPVTALPQCTSDGSLFIDMLHPKDLRQHRVISVQGKQVQTYLPAAISDIHDIQVFNFFASDSAVGFLVRGTKEALGAPGPGKSPGGVPWSKYHNYIAEFDRSGSYKESIELPMDYLLSGLAILSSGEFIVSGYDRVNSAARLLFLDPSGRLVRNIDLPAFRNASRTDVQFGSGESMAASSQLIGSVMLTPYQKHILIWRRGGRDPILDVGPGGSVREVPFQPPEGYALAEMIPATDRWVAHFRSNEADENAPMNEREYPYYELRPQDASLSARLTLSGVVPISIACEIDGTYLSYKRDNDGKLVLLQAE